MKQILNQPTERRLARRIPDSFDPGNVTPGDDAGDDMRLDNLIARSVSHLDRSPGLPSNFAYRTAMLAADKAMERRTRAERRERLLSWLIPAIAIIAAIAAVAIAVPDLPWIVADSLTRQTQPTADMVDLPSSTIWLGGTIAVVGILLLGLNAILKRIIAHRIHSNESIY